MSSYSHRMSSTQGHQVIMSSCPHPEWAPLKVIMSAQNLRPIFRILLQGNVRVSMSAFFEFHIAKFDSSVIAAPPSYLPKVSRDVRHLQADFYIRYCVFPSRNMLKLKLKQPPSTQLTTKAPSKSDPLLFSWLTKPYIPKLIQLRQDSSPPDRLASTARIILLAPVS